MAFPESVIKQVWDRSGGKCECTRTSCWHIGRCSDILTANNWQANHKTAVAEGGADTLSNCEALCIKCYKYTGSYSD